MDETPTKLIWVRSTLHLADGIHPGWEGQIDPTIPFFRENLGKTLFPLEEEAAASEAEDA